MSIRLAAMVVVAIPTALAATTVPREAGLPEWLVGRWCTEDGPRGQTCEDWVSAAGGTMLGVSRTLRDERMANFEFLRITLDDGMPVYLPQPGGQPPVAFRAVASTAGVAFVNAEHDYPQRIAYRMDGQELVAEISLADGSKPMRWRYRRVQ